MNGIVDLSGSADCEVKGQIASWSMFKIPDVSHDQTGWSYEERGVWGVLFFIKVKTSDWCWFSGFLRGELKLSLAGGRSAGPSVCQRSNKVSSLRSPSAGWITDIPDRITVWNRSRISWYETEAHCVCLRRFIQLWSTWTRTFAWWRRRVGAKGNSTR